MDKDIKIGQKVKTHYGFPLDNEVFEIIGIRENQVELKGDYSAGTHNVIQSEWVDNNMVKEVVE